MLWSKEVLHEQLDVQRQKQHRPVDDFIALVGAVDGILQAQAKADTAYFATGCGRSLPLSEMDAVEKQALKAYRWQDILSGAASWSS